jgi:predicted HTH domain antitoxin
MTTTLSVVIEVPSGLLGSGTEAELTADLRTTLAVRLFEEGRVSTGRAAQMAGMGKWEFIEELGRRKVPVVNWDEAEVQRELGYAHEGATPGRG